VVLQVAKYFSCDIRLQVLEKEKYHRDNAANSRWAAAELDRRNRELETILASTQLKNGELQSMVVDLSSQRFSLEQHQREIEEDKREMEKHERELENQVLDDQHEMDAVASVSSYPR
jgi:hypothetical protein